MRSFEAIAFRVIDRVRPPIDGVLLYTLVLTVRVLVTPEIFQTVTKKTHTYEQTNSLRFNFK